MKKKIVLTVIFICSVFIAAYSQNMDLKHYMDDSSLDDGYAVAVYIPPNEESTVFDDLSLSEGGYIVFTLNRRALISDVENLRSMLQSMVEKVGSMPIIAPLRGKAKDIVCRLLADMEGGKRVNVVEPLGYLDFSCLTAHARGIITDSGNVAEEATFNSVPCITLNSYTEHIETVKVGSKRIYKI